MRIKVKTLKTLVFAGILAIGGIFAGGMISKKVAHNAAYGETEQDYRCAYAIFGTTHDGNAYSGGNSSKEIETDEYKIGNYSNSNPSKGLQTDNPFRIGTKGNGGSVKVTIKKGVCNRVTIYAVGWPKNNDQTLTIGEDSQTVSVSKKNSGDLDFTAYYFENIGNLSSFTISSSKSILVKQISFRIYDK